MAVPNGFRFPQGACQRHRGIASPEKRGDSPLGGIVSGDRELVERVARGEEDALGELYRRHGSRVFRFALTLTGRMELAEEVVQETFLALWNGARGYAGRAQVSTWLLGIARNQALVALRREQKGSRVPAGPPELPNPEETVRADEKRAEVRRAVEGLPVEQREVVFLAFYEALPYGDISRILGVPEGTVKSRIYHAKRKLAEVLS